MNEALMIAGMTAVTVAARYPVLALFGRLDLPLWVLHALKFVPPAVLAAIVAPALLMPEGSTLNLRPDNAYLAGGIFAGLVAWRTKNLLLTIVLGMLAFWVWRGLV